MSTVLILADIHANLSALEAVLADSQHRYGTEMPICQLGDIIDYGPRPNEVVACLIDFGPRLFVNLAGNHEDILLGRGRERLSSDRGRGASDWTKSVLSVDSLNYLRTLTPGMQEVTLGGKRFLFVHGDLGDPYWGKLDGEERRRPHYQDYDFVVSGHSHIPHLDIVAHKVQGGMTDSVSNRDTAKGAMPNGNSEKLSRTVFINPGSVGQPRDRDPRAHYAVVDLDNGRISFEAVPYDIAAEVGLFNKAVDPYYWRRLFAGI